MITAAALAILPLAAACGSEKADDKADSGSGSVRADQPVTGTRWNVESVTVDGKKHQAATDTHLTFDEKTGKVGGRLGCNHVNAKATVSDGHITLGAPSTTRMMCEASLMNTEKGLLSLFGSKLSYRVDQDSLALTSQNGDTVQAVAAK